MTTLALFSDAHGYLPKIPSGCDLVLCAGDSVPCWRPYPDLDEQIDWFENDFDDWALSLGGIPVIYVAGNHDRILERGTLNIPSATYLQDNWTRVYGDLKIWGSPWQLPFGKDWAFNAKEEKLEKIYSKIPDNTDIIISHGPPYGYADKAFRPYSGLEFEHTGSKALLDTIDRVKPKLVVTGHIHEAWGDYYRNETTIINCSLLNEHYQCVREPIMVEL